MNLISLSHSKYITNATPNKNKNMIIKKKHNNRRIHAKRSDRKHHQCKRKIVYEIKKKERGLHSWSLKNYAAVRGCLFYMTFIRKTTAGSKGVF